MKQIISILNQHSQPCVDSLKNSISNCRFIFTCNFKNRIIEPLHSRCSVIEFKINGNKAILASQFMTRVEDILKAEGE